jgi:hypothetical protein
MTLLINAVPLLWLIASAVAFFFVFRPKADWPIVATPIRGLSVFILVFVGGAMLTAVTRPDEAPLPKPRPAQLVRTALPDPALVRAHPERYLALDRVKADRNKAGDVLLTGGATNLSGLAIANPRLACRMTRRGAPAGEVLAGEVSAVAEGTIPPGGKMIFAAINLGPAGGPWDGWSCRVSAASAP